MDSDPARGFAPHPGDAGGGGAVRQSSADAADVGRSGQRDDRRARQSVQLRYRWIGLPQIPEMFLEHLWISEDQRFFQHEGFDWKEMELAVKEAERKGKPVRGASTITNQCARSIFLWQGRSWIRKGLESYDTIWMEMLLPKRRILELYANVIEMGRGIYGVEAASQHYSASARVVLRGSNRPCWRRSCRIRKAGIRRSRAGCYDGVSGAFCDVNSNAHFPEQLLR